MLVVLHVCGGRPRRSKEEQSLTGVFLRVLDKGNDVLSVAVDIEGLQRGVTILDVGVKIDGEVAGVDVNSTEIVAVSVGGIKIALHKFFFLLVGKQGIVIRRRFGKGTAKADDLLIFEFLKYVDDSTFGPFFLVSSMLPKLGRIVYLLLKTISLPPGECSVLLPEDRACKCKIFRKSKGTRKSHPYPLCKWEF